MFKFEHQIFFYALAIIPICIGIYIWYVRQSKKNLKKLGELHLIKQLIPEVSNTKKNIKFILFTFI